MARVGKKTKRRRSGEREKKRRRAIKALAAAGAIAGGTQAYAGPSRFDNPPHGEEGHFHWAGPVGPRVWLDFTADADAQLTLP